VISPVVAVVVHWQDPEDTVGCVRSLRGEDVTPLVVDNGSHVPVGDLLGRTCPGVACLRLDRNRGYAGGANAGIRWALERDAEVVLLLNDDVRVRPGATAVARRRFAEDDRIAVVGPKVLSREDPARLWLAWGRITYGPSLVALSGADAPDGPVWDESRDVDWVAGCAMWLRASALREIGFFDETFFAYHEEVDWCRRAVRAGGRVVYEPAVVVTHEGRGASGGERSVRVRRYFCARNSVLFARKHANAFQRMKLAGGLAASLPLELAWHTLRGRPGRAWIKVRGVSDALRGRRPPLEALGLL